MARTSKPTVPTAPKPSRAGSTMRRTRRAPATPAAVERAPEQSAAPSLPEVEVAAVEPVSGAPVAEDAATGGVEPEAAVAPARPQAVNPAAATAAAEPIAAPVEDAAPAPQQAAAAPTAEAALVAVARSEPAPEPAGPKPVAANPASAASLPGITLGFWQEQLERTMATGQAILVCRSPEEAMRLQLSYMQATLVSGFERVGLMTRWSQDRVREVLPSRR